MHHQSKICQATTVESPIPIRLLLSAVLSLPFLWQSALPPMAQFVLATIIQFYGGYPFYKGAAALPLNKDTLIVLGTSMIYFFSVYNFWQGSPLLYFGTSALIITLLLATDWLEEKLQAKEFINTIHLSKIVERLLTFFVPIVIFISLLTAFSWWYWGHPTNIWIMHAAAVLLIASPCSIALATPSVVSNMLQRAEQNGILISEKPFDDSGTLTLGTLHVEDYVSCGQFSPVETLQLATALAHASTHPLCKGIVAEAARRGLDITKMASSVKKIPGQGIEGIVDNKRYHLGSVSLWKNTHQERPACFPENADEQTTLLFWDDEAVVAWFTFTDPQKVFPLARLARYKIRQNIFFACAFNAIGIALAAAGWVHPIIAAVAMGASTLIVLLNGLSVRYAQF